MGQEPVDTSAEKEEEDSKKLQECEQLLAETSVNFNATERLLEEPVQKRVEEEWSTESDSNSTAPDSINEKEKTPEPALRVEEPKEEEEEEEEKPPESAPPVKLIISKKKGSIFKSRSMVSDGGKKRHALYKHKWCDDKDTATPKSTDNPEASKSASSSYDFEFKNDPLVRVTRSSANKMDEEAVTGVKCTKNDKGVSRIPFLKIVN